jgi:ankyrin repeat protein
MSTLCFIKIYNCNINQCEPRTNQSPLIGACNRNKEAVVKLLTIMTGKHYWCITSTNKTTNRKITTMLINVNIMFYQNLNNVFITSFTGSIGGHTKVVTMLVKNKCDIDISDKDGHTALDIEVALSTINSALV